MVDAMRALFRLLVFSLLLAGAAPAADDPKLELRGLELRGLELRGKVKYGASRFRFLRVAIFHVESPFTASTLTDPGGEFRFRDLRPGTYTVTVVRRGLGEVRRSVVVTPGLADKKGVVRAEIPFSPGEAAKSGGGGTVSRTQLTVPFKASSKYAEAERRLNKHDVEGARKVLLEAVKVAPQYTSAWNFLGVLAYQSNDLDKAEEHFRHALTLEKEAFEPTVNLGGVLLSRKMPKDALAYNEKAVELRPKDALANAQLGMNYFQLAQFDRAVEYLEAAKEVDPAHFSQPQLFLSRIHERKGNRAAAAREIEDLLARRPDGAQAESLRRRLQRLQTR